jgi:hypothetical protein
MDWLQFYESLEKAEAADTSGVDTSDNADKLHTF